MSHEWEARRRRRHYSSARIAAGAAAALVATSLVAAAAGGSPRPTPGRHRNAGAPHRGGSLTVLEGAGGTGAWPSGLDPANDTQAAANITEMDAIYGELFELGPGGKTIDDLASGYQLLDKGKVLIIHLRRGVVFSDGTPFDAAAVVFNLRRDLSSVSTAKPTWSPRAIRTPNAHTVVIYLKKPDGAIIDQFQGSIVNWMVSPASLRRMGKTAFAEKPVGAGPFEVVSDDTSTRLVLRRNPHYWQRGKPYLDQLVFQATANDESALEDLRSGVAQAYEGLSTPRLVPGFRSAGLQVTAEPSTSPYFIQLNTTKPPFNNLKAREAIYYATDAKALDAKLFGDTYPLTESFTAPSGLFYDPKVPGYRTYDLAKARALVKKVGGISFDLFTNTAGENLQFIEALQAMYQQAGMKVTLSYDSLTKLIQTYISKHWQAALGTAGSFDPAAQLGVAFRFSPPSPFTGVHDGHLVGLLDHAQAAVKPATRAKYYRAAATYISDKAYGPFLFPIASWNVATKGVSGPGLTTVLPIADVVPGILWQDVSRRS